MYSRWIVHAVLLALAAAALAAGCSAGSGPYPVSGKLVYDDGQPASDLAGGDVVFISDELKISSTGEIDSKGRFQLTMSHSGDGTLPGRYKVVILPPPPPENPKQKAPKVALLSKYTEASKTDLTATV